MPGFNINPGGGFSFTPLTSTATTTSSTSSTLPFSFSTPTTTSTSTGIGTGPSTGGFSFTGLSGTTPAAATTTPASTAATSTFSFNFTNPTTTSASSSSPFNLGSSNTSGFNIGVKPATTVGIAGTTTPSTFSFSLPTSTTAPTGSSTIVSPFGLGTPATSTPLSTTKDETTATGIVPPASSTMLPGPTTSVPSIFGTSASLTTATTTSSLGTSGAVVSTNVSMRPLEERLNKWLVELKEQEERFVRQAAHVNAWDQILQNGHDQVQALKDTLHTVKSDQSRLEAEIDFIRGQQEELERLLEPLESATASNPATQLHQGDRQRDNMYYLAQSLDAQLRQMTDDLGKVIEHLNTNAKPWTPNDPVALVARILSAHMDTLKWVDQNTALLTQKMEEVARVAANAGKRG